MIFNETCQGICYNDFVIGPPSGYDDAFFEIRNVKVFQNSAAIAANSSSNSTTGSSSSNPTTGSSSNSNSTSNGNKTNSAQSSTKLSSMALLTLLSGTMMVFFGFSL